MNLKETIFSCATAIAISGCTPYTTVNNSSINSNKYKGCVALTYDDGPGIYTDRLLNILTDNNAIGTFYVVGKNVEKMPNVVSKAYQNGNEIGNHSYSHPILSDSNVLYQVGKTNKIISNIIGEIPKTIRPTYGNTNNLVNKKYYNQQKFVMWDIDTNDWRRQQKENPQNIIKTVKNYLSTTRKKSIIILMHDIHKTTVDSTKEVIDTVNKYGYKFSTVSGLKQCVDTL